MKYGFKTYKGKIYSFDDRIKFDKADMDIPQLAMMLPTPRQYTEVEIKEIAINRLKEILQDLGVKFYEPGKNDLKA